MKIIVFIMYNLPLSVSYYFIFIRNFYALERRRLFRLTWWNNVCISIDNEEEYGDKLFLRKTYIL